MVDGNNMKALSKSIPHEGRKRFQFCKRAFLRLHGVTPTQLLKYSLRKTTFILSANKRAKYTNGGTTNKEQNEVASALHYYMFQL